MKVPKVGINPNVCQKTNCKYRVTARGCNLCCGDKYGSENCPIPKKCPNKTLHLLNSVSLICCDDMDECPVARVVLEYIGGNEIQN